MKEDFSVEAGRATSSIRRLKVRTAMAVTAFFAVGTGATVAAEMATSDARLDKIYACESKLAGRAQDTCVDTANDGYNIGDITGIFKVAGTFFTLGSGFLIYSAAKGELQTPGIMDTVGDIPELNGGSQE